MIVAIILLLVSLGACTLIVFGALDWWTRYLDLPPSPSPLPVPVSQAPPDPWVSAHPPMVSGRRVCGPDRRWCVSRAGR